MASTKLPTSPFNGQKFIDSRSIEWTYDASTKTWRSGASIRDITAASETKYGLLTPELKTLLDGLPKRGGGFGIITKPLLSVVPLRREVAFRGSVKSAKLNESGSEIVVESVEFKNNQFIGKAIFFTSGILKAKAYMLYSNNADTIYIAGMDGSQAKKGDKFEIIDPLYLNRDGAVVGDIKFTSYSLDISCIDKDGNTIEGYCPIAGNQGDKDDLSGIDIKVSDSFLNEFCISIPGQPGPQGDQGSKGEKGQDGTGDGPIGLPGTDGVSASTIPSTITGIKVYDSNEIYDTAVIGLELDQNAGKLYVLKGKVRTPNNDRPAQQVIATAVSRDIQFTDAEYSYEIIAPLTDSLSDKDVSLLFYPKHVFSEGSELKVSDTEVITTKLSTVVDSMILHMKNKLKKISDDWDQKIKPFIESKDENARKELNDLANSVAQCEWGLGLEFCLGIDNKENCNPPPQPEIKVTNNIDIPGLEGGVQTELPNVNLKNPPTIGGGDGGGGGKFPPAINFPNEPTDPNPPNEPEDPSPSLDALNDTLKKNHGPLTGERFIWAYERGIVNEKGIFYGTDREWEQLRQGKGKYDPNRRDSGPVGPLYWDQFKNIDFDDLPDQIKAGLPYLEEEFRRNNISLNPINSQTNVIDPLKIDNPGSKGSPYNSSNYKWIKDENGNIDLPAGYLILSVDHAGEGSGYRSDTTTYTVSYDVYYQLKNGDQGKTEYPTPDIISANSLSNWDWEILQSYIKEYAHPMIINLGTGGRVALSMKTLLGNKSEGQLNINVLHVANIEGNPYVPVSTVAIMNKDGQIVDPSGGGGGGVSDVEFVIDAPTPIPEITSATPTDCENSEVTINGSLFTDGSEAPQVFFNEVEGTVSSYSPTYVTCTIPSSVLNDVNITVRLVNPLGGETTAPNLLSCDQPVINEIVNLTSGPVSSTSIRGGSTWRLVGDFGPSASTPTILLGGVACTVTSSSSTQIDFTVPELTSALFGYQDLSVTKDSVTTVIAGAMYIHDENPTVSSIVPTSGSSMGPTPVIITGTGFVTLSSPATPTVTFGGIPAVSITSFTATTIQCVASPHPAGYVTIQIENNDTNLTVDVPNFLYV